MNEGFQMKQKYELSLHSETLSLLRYCAYTTYVGIPSKKGHKKSNLIKFYPLRDDPKAKALSEDQIRDIENKREPLITNGKMRGYKDNDSNALYDFPLDGKIIAYVNEGVIELVN